MGEGNRAVAGIVFARHQDTHGRTHDIRPADDHAMLANGFDIIAPEHFHDAVGCGRQKSRHSLRHSSEIDRMKSIHVFFGVNSQGYFFFTDMFGQGQLHNKTVYFGILIEVLDNFQKVGL